DSEFALALARRTVELEPTEAWRQQSLGWALYRAGDWKASIEAIGKLADNSECDFILAMDHWQLGDKDHARASFDRGREWLKGFEQRSDDWVISRGGYCHYSEEWLRAYEQRCEEFHTTSGGALHPYPHKTRGGMLYPDPPM